MGKKVRARPAIRERSCNNCDECQYLGEGCFVCMAKMPPVIGKDDYMPIDDFLKCKGKDWQER